MLKMLFATDGSAPADAGREFLAQLPLRDVELLVLTVTPPPDDTFQQGWRAYELVSEAQKAQAERLLSETADTLAATGARISTQPRAGEAAHTIIEAARQFGADLIIVGSHGLSGFRAFFLGSVARNVAHHAGCSVLITRPPKYGLQQVIFGTDGSEHAAAAESLLAKLPLPETSRITAVTAVRLFEPMGSMLPMEAYGIEGMVREVRQAQEESARATAEAAAARLRGAGKQAEACPQSGDPATAILEQADARQADLVVVGARGVSLIEGLLVGSVAERVMKKAPCSVLVGR